MDPVSHKQRVAGSSPAQPTNIFNGLDLPLVIAGLNPSNDLIQLASMSDNVTLVVNPSDLEMTELIANAQINLLYTEQATGLKLKLLNN